MLLESKKGGMKVCCRAEDCRMNGARVLCCTGQGKSFCPDEAVSIRSQESGHAILWIAVGDLEFRSAVSQAYHGLPIILVLGSA